MWSVAGWSPMTSRLGQSTLTLSQALRPVRAGVKRSGHAVPELCGDVVLRDRPKQLALLVVRRRDGAPAEPAHRATSHVAVGDVGLPRRLPGVDLGHHLRGHGRQVIVGRAGRRGDVPHTRAVAAGPAPRRRRRSSTRGGSELGRASLARRGGDGARSRVVRHATAGSACSSIMQFPAKSRVICPCC